MFERSVSVVFYLFTLLAIAVFAVSAAVGIFLLLEDTGTIDLFPNSNNSGRVTPSFDIISANKFPNSLEFELFNSGEVSINGFLIYIISNNGSTVSEKETILEVGEREIVSIGYLSQGILDRVQIVPRIIENNETIYLYANQREYLFEPQIYCGNNVCELGETSSSCPTDCILTSLIGGGGGGGSSGGSNGGTSSSTCGNSICESNEDPTTCASDCQAAASCGNMVCESGENANSCALDCYQVQAWSWPETEDRLDYLHMLDQYAAIYEPYIRRSDGSPIIPTFFVSNSQLSVNPNQHAFINSIYPQYFTAYNPAQFFQALSGFYESEYPLAILGSYISGADCDTDVVTYPIQELNCNNFAANELLFNTYPSEPNRRRIDLTNPATAQKYIDLAVAEAFNRRHRFLYLDNILHPNSGGWGQTSMTWQTITSQLSQIRSQLNARGLKLAANFAGSPWLMKQNEYSEAAMFANAVDGMTFEGSIIFHPLQVRESPTNMQSALDVYRYWLDRDKFIGFIVVEEGSDQHDRVMEALYSGLAMMLWKDGDSLFVARAFQTTNDQLFWLDWPERFGLASGNYQFTPNGARDWTISRQFTNGKIYVAHHVTLHNTPITFTLPDTTVSYSVVPGLEPTNGQLTQINSTSYRYTPSLQRGSDAVVFASNYNSNGPTYTNLIIVGINTANPQCGNFICELTETIQSCSQDCQ